MTDVRRYFLHLGLRAILLCGLLPFAFSASAQDKTEAALVDPIKAGQRLATCGHSFHMFMPPILADLTRKAEINDHMQLAASSIGGSRIIQHWDVADEKNEVKKHLRSGKVDVLTLSPIFLPDPGIEQFVDLALEHNKEIRIVIQPIWLRFDIYEPTTPPELRRPKTVDHDKMNGEQLRALHEPYFKSMDEMISGLNQKHGKTVGYEVPAAQAIIALREKIIAGQAPGLKSQKDLFTDATGHGTPPLKTLVSYSNFAVIYRRSPIGLPVPEELKRARLGDQEEKLNKLLQEIAWAEVLRHPLSGVKAAASK